MNEPYVAGRPRRRQSGCFLKGCLTLMIVAMVMGVILGAVGTYIWRGIAPFISQEPAKIRIFDASDAQYLAVLAKVQPIKQAFDTGKLGAVELTAEDLDILIARDPAWRELRGKLYLEIVNNELAADVSVRANDDSSSNQVQAYFNGRFMLGASIAGGEFTGVIRRLETLDRQPVAALLARVVASPGFADSINIAVNHHLRDMRPLAAYLDKIRTAHIEHNRVLVLTVGEAAPAPVAAPATAE